MGFSNYNATGMLVKLEWSTSTLVGRFLRVYAASWN